jgi:hypothetical protein
VHVDFSSSFQVLNLVPTRRVVTPTGRAAPNLFTTRYTPESDPPAPSSSVRWSNANALADPRLEVEIDIAPSGSFIDPGAEQPHPAVLTVTRLQDRDDLPPLGFCELH